MSLLLKALKHAERSAPRAGGPDWSLEPMASPAEAPPRPAQAAADLIRAHEGAGERRRLVILLALLLLVLAGMGGYFYVAVYMPWLLLPSPPVPGGAPAPVPIAPPAATPPAPALPASGSDARRLAEPAPVPAAPAGAGGAVARPAAPTASVIATTEPPRAEPLVRPGPPAGAAPDELAAAHALLAAGRHEEARRAYEKLRLLRPGQPDVWLGLAAIAQAEHRHEDAVRLYARVLELDARNTPAQAALADLIGRNDPVAAEARLRQLLGEQPAGYLYFVLGNLLAAQGRWGEAQQAYFEAQRLEPDVADYAFNLAVSLEHLGEPRAAAEYYRRALQLAGQNPGTIHFDPAQAQARLRKLSSS